MSDPALLEIMARKVATVADEMAITLRRTSRSIFVKEAADFGVGVADLKGQMFAWPSATPGTMSMDQPLWGAIQAVPEVEPGDVIITNDAYTSDGLSTHLPDVNLIQPYFHEGRVVAYGWCFCHFSDVGGCVPGSLSATNTEVFQEGFRIPPMKLVRKGVLNRTFVDLFRANCRIPDINMGDMKAMLGALYTGRQRIQALIERHGADTILEAQEALQAYSAARARDALRLLKDGVYEFWDYVDDDRVTNIPIRLRVRMTVNDGLVHLDVTGTDPQVSSAFNFPSMGEMRSLLARRLLTFICTHAKSIAFNAGIYRPITTTIPPATVLNAQFPDAHGLRFVSVRRFSDVLSGAILQAAPKHMVAPASGSGPTIVALYEDGTDGGARKVHVIECLSGGMGAGLSQDGVDARDATQVNFQNHPVETVEAEAGVTVVDYDVHLDSGGPGRWRGGVGQSITVRVLRDGGALHPRNMDRFRFPAWGFAGGRPGRPTRCVLNLGRPGERALNNVDHVPVNAGDTLTIMMGGGSGYGDALKRDPERVLEDVIQGFVSRQAADADYGVVITGDAVDPAATRRLRQRRKARRPVFDFGPERDAWEAVFDDDAMCALNRNLAGLSRSVRQPTRRRIFDQVAPDLPRPGEGSFADTLADAAGLRRRLARAMDQTFGPPPRKRRQRA